MRGAYASGTAARARGLPAYLLGNLGYTFDNFEVIPVLVLVENPGRGGAVYKYQYAA